MKLRVSVFAAAAFVGAAALVYSPAEAPAFSCAVCDSDRMDESEMCSIGTSVMKHSFGQAEGPILNYNSPHTDWKCGYCVDYHTACGEGSTAAISDLKRAIGRQEDIQDLLAKHAKVAKYDPESGQVMVAGCGEHVVGIAVPEALQGSLGE